jgi:hypothetical protein
MPWIDSYVRRDGTPVRAHWRSAAGSGTGVLIFGAFLLLIAGHHGHAAAGTSHIGPAPARTVHYPITFPPVAGRAHAAVPQPTVSYPIKFSDEPRTMARPENTVSYPIRFPSSGNGR